MPLVQSGRIYAEVGGAINTGVAIANPNTQRATISFYFTSLDGANFGSGTTTIEPNGQTAAFLNQSPFNGGPSIDGTFTFNSNVPVAVVALRGRTNERGDFLLSTLNVNALTAPTGEIVYFPHFADGGGWSTQIVLINPTEDPMTGRVQFLDQGSDNAPAQPTSVTVGAQSGSTFSYTIPARSSRKLQTSGVGAAIRSGSIRVIPDVGARTPSGSAIFSFRNAGVTVTEAGVPASRPGRGFRLYAEASDAASGSVQTGIAITNASRDGISVNFELTTLTGASTGLTGTNLVPGNGQVALFLNQIPGFESLRAPFQGMLRISTSSTAGISVIGLRARTNERSDFLIATMLPVDEGGPVVTGPLLFPHFADGGGYSTQLVLYSRLSGQASAGTMTFTAHSGNAFTLTLTGTSPVETGACAVPAGSGAGQVMNGWTVDGDQVLENRIIRVNGTLQIRRGTLTLRNVALEINAVQSLPWRPGNVVAIEIARGAGLMIADTRMVGTSSEMDLILGIDAATAVVENTCFRGMGIYLTGLGPRTFRQNEFVLNESDRMEAMTIFDSRGAKVEDNTIRGGSGGMTFFSTQDSTVLRNTITADGGIGLSSSSNNRVAGNVWKGPAALTTIDANVSNWWSINTPGHAGIGLERWSNNNVIEDNILMGSGSAILLVFQSAGNTISKNTIRGAGYGITLRYASQTLVDGNELEDVFTDAIHAHRSYDLVIANNRIHTSGTGVAIYASMRNSIKSNTVTDCDRGIFLHQSPQNTIDGNTISGGFQGLFLASSSTNEIARNNIIASDYAVWDDSPDNSWQGNYWPAPSGAPRAIQPAAAVDRVPAQIPVPPTVAAVSRPVRIPFTEVADNVITIRGREVWQGTRTIAGSIVIENGSSLTLRAATLTYLLREPTKLIWIHVRAGGSLTVEDSRIIGPEWDHSLSIKVYRGARFSMKRSELRNAGSWVGTFAAAIANEADDIVIEDSTFIGTYCAFSGEGAPANTRFLNNTIINSLKAIELIGPHPGAVVTGSRVVGAAMWGIGIWPYAGFAPSQVTDNVFSESWGPAIQNFFNAGGFTIARNTFNNVKGPGVFTREAGAQVEQRQLHVMSTNVSAARAGDTIDAVVNLANVMPGVQPFSVPDPRVFLVSLNANGRPVQTRRIALPFGHLQRVRLRAVTPEAGPYDISIDTMSQGIPSLAVSRPELRFTALAASEAPPQPVGVVNSQFRSNLWEWTAESDSPWLRVSPASGVGAGEFFVFADASGLSPGNYTGRIQLSSPSLTPEFVGVTLSVVEDTPIIVAAPSALLFERSDEPKQVTISILRGRHRFPFAISVRTYRGGNWLSAAADSTTMPATLTVSVNATSLPPGQYRGEVQISGVADNSPMSVPVLLSIP